MCSGSKTAPRRYTGVAFLGIEAEEEAGGVGTCGLLRVLWSSS